jgi:predicted N-formylglutamate amidohydrolase
VAGLSLLGPNDPPPVCIEGEGDSAFVIVVDHAGRAIPERLARLGLAADALERHIAHDIGALGLARRLGAALSATVISQAYSRLVIDCNRGPDEPRAVLEVSDGVAIPGNIGLSAAQRAARASAIHAPYHRAIGQVLAARRGQRTVLLCQHSFTPVMNGQARPWHVGVLHLVDSAVSDAMLDLLRREADLAVGDNQPYAMDGTDFTAPFHVAAHACEMLELEVRQDLIAEAAGQAAMAERLAPLLRLAVAQSRLGARHSPSWGDGRADQDP